MNPSAPIDERVSGALLRPPQAAVFLGLSTSTLAKFRVRGDGPPFCKLGRAVAYRRDDLEAWLVSRMRRSTSDSAAAGVR